MRSSRLLAMLMLCRTRERWTAAELADELEVSVRTVYRDVEALQAAGVPLWTTSGPGGGIHLLPGWRTELGALTGDEAAALSLAGVPGALADLGLGTVALSAQLKVRGGMPAELRARADRVAERFHLDAPGWFHHDDPVVHLAAVAEGVWSGRRLDITYRSGRRTFRRRLDPLGLVLKAGTWYLVAGHRGVVRTYRVGRIRSCDVRGELAGRPEGFDLAAWWDDSSAAFDASLLRVSCVLRLSPTAIRLLAHAVGPSAAEEALAATSEPDDEGWRTLRVRGESEEVLADQLLGLADRVEVLEPASLRARLRELGEAIAARHRHDPG